MVAARRGSGCTGPKHINGFISRTSGHTSDAGELNVAIAFVAAVKLWKLLASLRGFTRYPKGTAIFQNKKRPIC